MGGARETGGWGGAENLRADPFTLSLHAFLMLLLLLQVMLSCAKKKVQEPPKTLPTEDPRSPDSSGTDKASSQVGSGEVKSEYDTLAVLPQTEKVFPPDEELKTTETSRALGSASIATSQVNVTKNKKDPTTITTANMVASMFGTLPEQDSPDKKKKRKSPIKNKSKRGEPGTKMETKAGKIQPHQQGAAKQKTKTK